MSNRRSRLSRTKATESIGPARIFRRRVVRKSSALACIRGRPDFLPARSDLIVKILVCCRQMGSYPETTFEDLWVRSTFSAARLPPCRLLDNFTSRSPKTTDAIQCPPSDNCRGRDDHHGSPPAQIRTSASTHTALTKDEWRRSGHRDRGTERGVAESTGSRLG